MGKVTWISHIYPIFAKRARADKWNAKNRRLADYDYIVKNKHRILSALLMKNESPAARYILPSKLTEKEKNLLTTWLTATEKPLLVEIGDYDSLVHSLKMAVQLELSTIPLYLAAMYSIPEIVNGTEHHAYSTLKYISIQEMGHMGLVVNILVSMGEDPEIISETDMPSYPGTLPGGVLEGVDFHLKKMGDDQLHAFMDLEQPDSARQPRMVDGNWQIDSQSPLYNDDTSQTTIGEFYESIILSINSLSTNPDSSLSFGNTDKQLTYDDLVTTIGTKEEAVDAINKIIREGEGGGSGNPANTSISYDPGLDPTVSEGSTEVSHFYKFLEISLCKQILTIDPGVKIVFNGLDLDPLPYCQIADMQEDPSLETLVTDNDDARNAAEAFSNGYSCLLKQLELAWNNPEDNENSLAGTIRFMRSLKPLANTCMSEVLDDATNKVVGTPFEYTENPSYDSCPSSVCNPSERIGTVDSDIPQSVTQTAFPGHLQSK